MPTSRTRTTNTSGTTKSNIMTRRIETLKSSTMLPSYFVVSTWDDVKSFAQPGYYKSINDWVTPNYRKLVARGAIINNPVTIVTAIETNPVLTIDFCRKTYKHMTLDGVRTEGLYSVDSYSGEWNLRDAGGTAITAFKAVTPLTSELKTIDNLATLEAWSKINDSDILIGACIAESSKTTRDLLVLARKVLKVGKTLRRPRMPKRINKASIKAAAREAEELYMQARYNLRPLYHDILGVMKLTEKKHYADRFTYRGLYAKSQDTSDEMSRLWHFNNAVKLTIKRESQHRYEARAGVLCNVQDETAWRRMGVSLIAETAWELVPFSFIGDWFFTFGDLISAWTPAPGVKTLTSWLTTTQQWEQSVSVHVDSCSEVDNPTFVLGSTSRTETYCNGLDGVRTKSIVHHNRIPNPKRPFLPQLKVNLDPLKTLDLAIIGRNITKAFKNWK